MKKQKFPYKQSNQSKHRKTLMSQLRNRTLCNLNENTNIIEEFYGSNFDNVM